MFTHLYLFNKFKTLSRCPTVDTIVIRLAQTLAIGVKDTQLVVKPDVRDNLALDMSNQKVVWRVVGFELVEDIRCEIVVHSAIEAISEDIVHGDGLCILVEN